MCTGHDSSSEHPPDDQRPSGVKKEGKTREGEHPEGGRNRTAEGAEENRKGKNREITALFTPQEEKTSQLLQQNNQQGTKRKWR